MSGDAINLPPTRRQVIGGLVLVPLLPSLAAAAVPSDGPLVAAWRELGIAPEAIRWTQELSVNAPAIADDGAAVPVTVRLAAPANTQGWVLHLFAPANRKALIASLTPGEAVGGRIEATLRIRLAKTQSVTVLAQQAGGPVLGAAAEVQVTASGGCRT